MKAFVLREYNRPMEMEERELSPLGEDDVLVKVKACGICQTDLKIFKGEIPPPIVTLPHIPGHEIAGEVIAVGEKVTWIQKGGYRHSLHLYSLQTVRVVPERAGKPLPGPEEDRV